MSANVDVLARIEAVWGRDSDECDAVAELIEAANEMMRQDAVQRATEITNPFMAGAADKLASALRKVGAR